MIVAPYGSWPSPITPDALASASVRLSAGLIDAGVRYWAEGHPEQAGRIGLWRQLPGQPAVELTPGSCVRTAVNEYGGGAWTVAGGLVAYSSWPDGAVHLIEDGKDRVLTAVPGLRFAGLSLAPQFRLLLAVREDHRAGEAAVEQTVVGLDLDGPNHDGGTVLASGADFYAHPCLSADGRLAWCEWDQPAMPWDTTRIVIAPLAEPRRTTQVEQRDEVSSLYPSWAEDGALIYLCDADGYWNFRRYTPGNRRRLRPEDADFCGPLWVHDPAPYALIDAGRIGCSWLVGGFAHLGVLSFDPDGTDAGCLTELDSPAVAVQLAGRGGRCLPLLGFADRPAQLVELDWKAQTLTPVAPAAPAQPEPGLVSVAVDFTWPTPDGPGHAWFYPPANPAVRAPDGKLPPVQVWSHGGPTAFAEPGYSPSVQFWTSRGIGILDVNYAGSAGYGRAYRNRLRGRWGLSDVRDCADAALALAEAGLADRDRLSIRGGSAGGFTTLAALTGTDVFAAGISLYGIGDLEALATDTHKFEARYLDGLVAPYPAGRQVYLDRSPIHHLDRLHCPMLILQGTEDSVVPPEQATAMAEAVRAQGLSATVIMFDGEGHGFRRAETIAAVAEAALTFLGEVHSFVPAAG